MKYKKKWFYISAFLILYNTNILGNIPLSNSLESEINETIEADLQEIQDTNEGAEENVDIDLFRREEMFGENLLWNREFRYTERLNVFGETWRMYIPSTHLFLESQELFLSPTLNIENLSTEDIGELRSLSPKEEEEDNCAICQELFGNKDVVQLNFCEHLFHKTCLFSYLEHSPPALICPLCRNPLLSE
jgi:hypothetical protein